MQLDIESYISKNMYKEYLNFKTALVLIVFFWLCYLEYRYKELSRFVERDCINIGRIYTILGHKPKQDYWRECSMIVFDNEKLF